MKKQSVTKTVESGAYTRTTLRMGKKRVQKTIRFKKNQKKVVLAHIGEFELYVYPFDYPDTVFLGQFPISTKLELSNVKQLLTAFNKARWYLKQEAYSKPKKDKGANAARRSIQRAYKTALTEFMGKEKPPIP